MSRISSQEFSKGAQMPVQQNEVVFLGEVSCPEPYSSYRVPVYRVIRLGHPLQGKVITEQQVLQEGLFHSGLAPALSQRVAKTRKK
jgi:hypothetical protein